jgi:ABC-type transport system substrate-binding protein
MRLARIVASGLVAFFAFSAALQAAQAPHLITGVAVDPVSLDLTNARGPIGRSIAALIVDPLIARTEELRIAPVLARNWETSTLPDGRWRARFTLRTGVRFDRGETFNASDAVATIVANCGIKDFGTVTPLTREQFEIVFPRPFQ